ncbi:restriction endonuclease subunit S [Dietzia psychralcaliphila]|uniref:restriction endonuclease subunit S n=1 Tax=Dietzia psychralcaliphila TaxID=139021 RepID=UPI000D30821F|nr:restriction endonuclease subunit S [Dietzia psychralcaliphila]PTM89783.1 type I restriction enzyme S subunit [Dietzia psychralcaliphila]
MSEWRDKAIGDLGTVVTGSTPPSRHPDWFGNEVPFVTPSDMNEGDRRPSPGRCLSRLGRVGLRTRIVPANAVAFVCIGATIGKVCLLPTESVTNQQINTIVPNSDTDSRFLYYLLRYAAQGIAQGASGAATPIINKSVFASVVVRVPDLATQIGIGQVLGSFDDLIENNRRRVEVLEEMARAIYHEWFVKFRYPGHSDVPLIDSSLGPIPEGWMTSRLGEVATFKGGSTTTKSAYVDDGYRAFSAAGQDGYLPTFEVEGDGVVLSAVGARCGRTFWASGRWSSIANTIKILPKDASGMAIWLYFATANPAIWPKRGSAQPFVSINDARNVPVVVAKKSSHELFESVVRPIFDQAHALRTMTVGLIDMRDVLLPRLVTGQIDVSTLNLDALLEGATA